MASAWLQVVGRPSILFLDEPTSGLVRSVVDRMQRA